MEFGAVTRIGSRSLFDVFSLVSFFKYCEYDEELLIWISIHWNCDIFRRVEVNLRDIDGIEVFHTTAFSTPDSCVVLLDILYLHISVHKEKSKSHWHTETYNKTTSLQCYLKAYTSFILR